MVGSFLATKWPILIRFCWIVHQKSKFSLISDTSSVGGCWGQPILLFWKLVDETQMVKPPEPTIYHNSKRYLILLPLRAIDFRSFHYERHPVLLILKRLFCLHNWTYLLTLVNLTTQSVFIIIIQVLVTTKETKDEVNPYSPFLPCIFGICWGTVTSKMLYVLINNNIAIKIQLFPHLVL